MANAKMYTFLEKNIGAFPGLHKLTHTQINVWSSLFLKTITI